MSQFINGSVTFLVYDARTVNEYYNGAFIILTASIEPMCAYLITIWEYENILEFIDNCEEFIEEVITKRLLKNPSKLK